MTTFAKSLCLPNGHRTTSDRITAVRVHPNRSVSLQRIYAEVFENGQCVFEGLVDLDRIEDHAREHRRGIVRMRRAVSLNV